MFQAIAGFVETMLGLWDVIAAGIRIAEIDTDGSLFNEIMQSAHLGAWQDIIQNEGLNNGQLAMANMAMDAGSEYIDSIGFSDWSAEDYKSEIRSQIDGFEGISQVTEQAAVSVNHAVTSSTTGLAGWLGSQRGV